jgi:hypothetical protein
MSVPTDSAQKTYTGNGTAGPYAIDFPVLYDDGGNAEDIIVTKVTIATSAQEDVTATSTIAGLNVTLAAVASNAYYIVLSRVPDFTQEDGYSYLNAIPSETLERALDKLTMMCQWLKNRWAAISSQITTPVAVFIDALGASATLTTLGFSDFIKTLVDDNDAATARTTLGIPAATTAALAAGHLDIGAAVGIGGAHNDSYALKVTGTSLVVGSAQATTGIIAAGIVTYGATTTQDTVYDGIASYCPAADAIRYIQGTFNGVMLCGMQKITASSTLRIYKYDGTYLDCVNGAGTQIGFILILWI